LAIGKKNNFVSLYEELFATFTMQYILSPEHDSVESKPVDVYNKKWIQTKCLFV